MNAGPGGIQGQDLLGTLWSDSVTHLFEELIKDLAGAVLPNVQSHPRHVGRVFEQGLSKICHLNTKNSQLNALLHLPGVCFGLNSMYT